MGVYGVCVTKWISVALRLEASGKPYAGLHGHDYRLTACVEGPVTRGMVIDHYELEEMLSRCTQALDHRSLNEALGTDTPTAETLVGYVKDCLESQLPRSLRLVLVTACTATGYCSYYREDTAAPQIRAQALATGEANRVAQQ